MKGKFRNEWHLKTSSEANNFGLSYEPEPRGVGRVVNQANLDASKTMLEAALPKVEEKATAVADSKSGSNAFGPERHPTDDYIPPGETVPRRNTVLNPKKDRGREPF